jgi:hypothetical protein
MVKRYGFVNSNVAAVVALERVAVKARDERMGVGFNSLTV